MLMSQENWIFLSQSMFKSRFDHKIIQILLNIFNKLPSVHLLINHK
jgi:hypothetical protein